MSASATARPMRIIAGQFKGRSITAAKGRGTRPTADRTRESLFNILSHAAWAPVLDGARIVDCFAGSGALGLEALSRGAAYCVYIETDTAARGAIRQNVDTLQLFGVTRIHRRSATSLGDKPSNVGDPFNIAFLDPPYDKGLVAPCLKSLSEGGWLADGALVIVETSASEELELTGWKILETRTYGAAKISFLAKQLPL